MNWCYNVKQKKLLAYDGEHWLTPPIILPDLNAPKFSRRFPIYTLKDAGIAGNKITTWSSPTSGLLYACGMHTLFH